MNTKLKYFLQRFRWLKVLNSPFKPFKVSFYAGKTRVGVPYFYPRRWVKYTDADAIKASIEHKANKNKVQVSDKQLFEIQRHYLLCLCVLNICIPDTRCCF